MDAAALGVPCIGSPTVDTQRELFPLLTLEHPFQFNEATKLVRKLKIDEEFYNEVVEFAHENVWEFDIKNLHEKFVAMVEEVKK
ncbi:MAG: hypothetical protein DRN20_06290 [Thermoplasmata archaeon]|nr:MAG: hypothetical protein DRN20_06290 [Thermoplasmata archaeon]